MASSLLVRIDRVLGKTKSLIEAADLTENAEDAYQRYWSRIEKPFKRKGDEDSDAYRAFAYDYDNFREERDTIPAILLGLKDIGYPGPGIIETLYTAVENPRAWEGAYTWAFEQLHSDESERAEALAKIQDREQETDWRPPGLLENLHELEQALMKAREFCSDEQGQPSAPKPKHFQAYWLDQAGRSQQEIAKMLNTTQGTISKWLKTVEKWKTAGNAMPEIPKAEPLDSKPVAIDPAKLDWGPRSDHRAPHQAEKLAGIQRHDGKE